MPVMEAILREVSVIGEESRLDYPQEPVVREQFCAVVFRSLLWWFLTRATPVEQRVENGIAFLDQTYGSKWRRKINWETLDIGSSEKCILGQLEGDYHTGKQKLGLNANSSWERGFYTNLWEIARISHIWKEKGASPSIGY